MPRTADETAGCGCNGDWQVLNCLVCLNIEMSREAGQLPYWECSEEHDHRVDDVKCGGAVVCSRLSECGQKVWTRLTAMFSDGAFDLGHVSSCKCF